MKLSLLALVASLSFAVVPVASFAFDTGSLTPPLEFPQPAPEPVSQDRSGVDN